MTANRWWVKMAARWLARVDGVSNMIRLAMLLLTGVSTATISLQQYGYGHLAGPFIAVVGAATLVFTYLYSEGGVWNQVARDRNDLAANWAGPNMRIQQELAARGILSGAIGRELSQEERQTIQQELDAAFAEYRDGIDPPAQ